MACPLFQNYALFLLLKNIYNPKLIGSVIRSVNPKINIYNKEFY